MFAPRLNPWDFDDVAPDEELPSYEASSAPAYDEGPYHEPLVTYHLKQYDRRIQMLVAHGGASAASSYRITTNGFRMFSKKPEMEVLFTSREMRQRNIAEIRFDSDGPLPWCPRAHYDYMENGSLTVHQMEARNFVDWRFAVGGTSYEWMLSIQPSSALILRAVDSALEIARFTYSLLGTQAMRGAEVGELMLFRDRLTMEAHGSDMVVCSLMVALRHLKKMGRNYFNNPEQIMRVGSMAQEPIPAHRGSSAGMSMI
jgi:hypothetical protein